MGAPVFCYAIWRWGSNPARLTAAPAVNTGGSRRALRRKKQRAMRSAPSEQGGLCF